MIRPRWLLTAILAPVAAGPPAGLAAQSYLERTPHLDGGWVGLPGVLYMDDWALFRKAGSGDDVLLVTPVYRTLLTFPRGIMVGGTLAANARPDGKDVLELFARVARPASRADQWQLSLTAGYSRPERSLDGEVASWKAVGPVRLLAAARGYGDLDGRGTRAALLGGVLVPLAPGRIPLALAGDIGVVLGDGETSRPLWSIGLHTGLASTPFTIAFQASNARDPGFQGAAVEAEDIHFGVAVMSPIPVGGILGWLAPREQAERAVHGGADPAQPMALARISRHAYWPSRLEIEAGTTVEWVNDDVAHHSITAVDASFDSGILGGGEVWRARFNEPGTYLYQCGPHPYMQGVVVVSPRPRGSRTRGGTPASVERPSDHQRGSPLRGRP